MKLCAKNQGPGPWFLGGEVESGLETPTEDRVCTGRFSLWDGPWGHGRTCCPQRHGQVLPIIRVCVCVCVCVCVYAGMFRAVCSDSRLEAHWTNAFLLQTLSLGWEGPELSFHLMVRVMPIFTWWRMFAAPEDTLWVYNYIISITLEGQSPVKPNAYLWCFLLGDPVSLGPPFGGDAETSFQEAPIRNLGT